VRADDNKVNDQIRSSTVLLIDDEGVNKGKVSLTEALDMAYELDLDVVQVGGSDAEPVVRLMSYSKFRYEQQTRAKQAAKASRGTSEIKQVKLRPTIDEHDYLTKVAMARKFLLHGNRVKVTVMFKGRLQSRPEMGVKLLERVGEDLADVAKAGDIPPMMNRDISMLLTPLKDD
jgi:translation initiation factor IF-3